MGLNLPESVATITKLNLASALLIKRPFSEPRKTGATDSFLDSKGSYTIRAIK